MSWNHDKIIVYCGFDPTFISKTQPKTGIIMAAPLVIRARSHFVGSAEPEELVLSCKSPREYYERARQEGHVGPVSACLCLLVLGE